MHTHKDCKDHKIAWSEKDWIYVGKLIPDVNTKKIKTTLLAFISAIHPKLEDAIHISPSGKAYWTNISESEYASINTAQIVWGIKKDKIIWDASIETLVLKSALRLWKYKSGNYILDFISETAKKRRTWLLKELALIKKNKAWDKIRTSNIDVERIEDSVATLKLNTAETAVIKRAVPIIKELLWKNKQVPTMKKWLAKNTHIPEQAGMYLIDAWSVNTESILS